MGVVDVYSISINSVALRSATDSLAVASELHAGRSYSCNSVRRCVRIRPVGVYVGDRVLLQLLLSSRGSSMYVRSVYHVGRRRVGVGCE